MWAFHQVEQPLVIFKAASETMLADGWKNSPAECEGFLDKMPIDAKNPIKIQIVGETVAEEVDRINGALNIHLMTAKQLKEYSLRHHDAKLSNRKKVAQLRAEVEEMIKAKQEGSS